MARETLRPDWQDFVLHWHRTKGCHIWIDGVTGGYAEQHENGKYFTHEIAAVNHRCRHIEQLRQKENTK